MAAPAFQLFLAYEVPPTEPFHIPGSFRQGDGLKLDVPERRAEPTRQHLARTGSCQENVDRLPYERRLADSRCRCSLCQGGFLVGIQIDLSPLHHVEIVRILPSPRRSEELFACIRAIYSSVRQVTRR